MAPPTSTSWSRRQPLNCCPGGSARTRAHHADSISIPVSDGIHRVETKAQQQVNHPNVQRKPRAAATWCARINALEPGHRGEREWHYALVGESLFFDWRDKGARMGELLSFARVRNTLGAQGQAALDLGD